MWQMELQTFVAITCQATLRAPAPAQAYFQSVSGMFGRIRAAVSARPDVSLCAQFQHSLLSYLCSGGLEWGACGLQAYLFTLRASSIVHPPASFEGFFTFLCSLLFWEQVMGSAHGSLLWHSWISVWSGSAGILSYRTYRPFGTHLRYFYCSKLNTTTACHHFILLYWAETW